MAMAPESLWDGNTWVAVPMSVMPAGQLGSCSAFCSSSARPMPSNATA